MSQIDISNTRVDAALKLFQTYGAPLGVRTMVTATYPGGSYVYDQITFTNQKDASKLVVSTNLAIVAPGVTLNELSGQGFINPPLNGVDTAMVYPGVNDFGIDSTVKPPVIPPVNTNFIGPEMIPGSGRHYALASPLDHFPNGGLCFQNGKYYVKIIVATPFGNSVEWDEVTVVGT